MIQSASLSARSIGGRAWAFLDGLFRGRARPKAADTSTDQAVPPQSDEEILVERVKDFLRRLLQGPNRPPAPELLKSVEQELGRLARWAFTDAVGALTIETGERGVALAGRAYLAAMLDDGSLAAALDDLDADDAAVLSSVDGLLRQSVQLRKTRAFHELIDFTARFRRYSVYNNMLVRLQNPSCTFYARQQDWQSRFKRVLKRDTRPMLILAPMHPLLLVYDLDQTVGPPLPRILEEFAQFSGPFQSRWLNNMCESAKNHAIDVEFKALSSTHGGFATTRAKGTWKMRIVIHDEKDEPSRFGVLCHEMAHVLLGHLGSDADLWWPARTDLDHATEEIEAEAVAYIVTTRLGLSGTSDAYVAQHDHDGEIPISVSLDSIAKVAGRLERMAMNKVPAPKERFGPGSG